MVRMTWQAMFGNGSVVYTNPTLMMRAMDAKIYPLAVHEWCGAARGSFSITMSVLRNAPGFLPDLRLRSTALDSVAHAHHNPATEGSAGFCITASEVKTIRA